MKENTVRFLRIYRMIHSISIIICGLCLMCGCLSIYHAGDSPYSREAVALAFSKIAVPVYLCLALTLGNFMLALFLPTEGSKGARSQDLHATLKRLNATKDLTADSAIAQQIAQERKKRRLHLLLRNGIFAVSAVIFLIYALNPGHFHDSDINGSMIKAMYRFVPCVLVSFAVAVYTAAQQEKSLRAEIALLKQLPSNGAAAPKNEDADAKKTNLLRLAFLAAGLGLVIFGACTGGIADVLAKAINICTECIGLG